jgi:DnaK suppressor protein
MTIKKTAKKVTKKTFKKVKEKQKKTAKKTKLEKSIKKIKKLIAKHKKPVKAKRVTPAIGKAETKKVSEENKEAIRRFLIQKREQIVKEAKTEISKYIKGETRQLVDTALDDGDWSIVDLSEDVSLRQLGFHRETLLKIDASLRKLAEGTYGICEECGEEISPERLKVLPFAILCRDCQERNEQLEAIERE